MSSNGPLSSQQRSSAERSGSLIAALSSGSMIAQLVVGKAARDALFLSNFELSRLPLVMLACAAVSMLAVLGVARMMTRYSPARVVPVMFGVSATLFVCEWALSAHQPRLAALAVYFHVGVFGGTTVSAFWSVVNERFDPYTAKRLVSRIGSGGTLGGVLGGLLAWRSAGVLSLPTLLLLLGVMNLCALLSVRGLVAGSVERKTGQKVGASDAPKASGFSVIRAQPYLRNLAVLVLLGATTQALLDFLLAARAQVQCGKGPPLLAFFALFHMLVGLVTFLTQITLSRIALERLGLAWTVAVVSVTVALAGTGAFFARTLSSVVLLRGSEAVVRNSAFRAAYELLFMPLPPQQKRPTKTLIDVGFDRIGTTIGSGIILVTTALAATHLNQALLVACVGLSLASLPLALMLHQGYVTALETSLRSGALTLDATDVVDLTTRRTLTETTQALDREKLLESIQELRAQSNLELDDILQDIASLRSADDARIREVFTRTKALAPALVPHAIALLGNRAVVRDALSALRRVAPSVTGQLVDALLQRDLGLEIRRRVPRVLEVCTTPRAVAGLMLGLCEPSFEVRRQCAEALLELTERHPALLPAKDAIFAAAAQEFSHGPDGNPDAALQQVGVEQVFRVLSLALEREPLNMAFRGLSADDHVVRGTSLEYLSVVLPPAIQASLWPLVATKR